LLPGGLQIVISYHRLQAASLVLMDDPFAAVDGPTGASEADKTLPQPQDPQAKATIFSMSDSAELASLPGCVQLCPARLILGSPLRGRWLGCWEVVLRHVGSCGLKIQSRGSGC